MTNNNNKIENEVVSEQQTLVKEFIDEIERKLPFWLKSQKEELKEILEELENHIWDRACEIAKSDEPTPSHIQQVINQMGSASKIAAEYKRRGKPKFYITEELIPMYQKMLIIVLGICGAINILIALTSIGSRTAGNIFSGLFSGLAISCAVALILITIQFVFLSMEGYLPEDFQKLSGRIPIIAIPIGYTLIKSTEEKKTEASTIVEEPIIQKEVVDEKPVRIIRETTYPETTFGPSTYRTGSITVIPERSYIEEPRVTEKPRKIKAKHLLGKDYLSEGIAGIAFGVVIMILPFMPFMQDLIPDNFKYWIAILGALAFIGGFLKFLQAIAGRMMGVQQLLMILGLIPQGLHIPLYLALLKRHDIIFDWIWEKVSAHISLIDYTRAFTGIVWFIVAMTIIGLISQFVRFIRLSTEGFPQSS